MRGGNTLKENYTELTDSSTLVAVSEQGYASASDPSKAGENRE